MRICSALFVGVSTLLAIPAVHAQDNAQRAVVSHDANDRVASRENLQNSWPRHSRSTDVKPGLTSLESASAFSLAPVSSTEPLIRQASLTVKAKAPVSQNGFTEAPLPDDDLDAPKERGNDGDATLRPDFFQRNHHQVGDALAGGAGANDQRRGHGSMAAGVAVAIPMD